MRNKRGSLLDEESVKVILAVVVFVAMVFLMVKLFSPVFNKEDKMAEAYLDRLKVLISEADSSEGDSFVILDNGKDDLDFYLVYFGKVSSFSETLKFPDPLMADLWVEKELVFRHKMSGDRIICVCSDKKDSVACNSCENLDLPAKFSDSADSENWVVGEGVRVRVYRDAHGGKYDFKSF